MNYVKETHEAGRQIRIPADEHGITAGCPFVQLMTRDGEVRLANMHIAENGDVTVFLAHEVEANTYKVAILG